MAKPQLVEQFSFLGLAKAAAADIPTKTGARSKDKVANARDAILDMIPNQKGYLDKTVAGEPLPKTKSGDRTVSTWFTNTEGGFWTNIRWGQRSLKLGENKAWFFDTPTEVHTFYDAVETAIKAGELDEVIRIEANKKAAPPLQVAAE